MNKRNVPTGYTVTKTYSGFI